MRPHVALLLALAAVLLAVGSEARGAERSLPAGSRVTVKAQYKAKFNWLEFHLCNANGCSVLWLSGPPDASTPLRYDAFTDCDKDGNGCTTQTKESEGAQTFSNGELEFVAENRPGQLAVWLASDPDHVATVPVKEDSDKLFVAPPLHKPAYSMDVQFE